MVIILDGDKQQKAGETATEYIYRMCSTKEATGRTWKQISSLCNETLGLDRSESWYRKHHANHDFLQSDMDVNTVTTHSEGDVIDSCTPHNSALETDSEESYLEQIKAATAEMHAERIKLADERTSRNAIRRLAARDETIIEIAREYAKIMAVNGNSLEFEAESLHLKNNQVEGVLLLSDWHYGMVCENSWNIYNPDVCKSRVTQLLQRAIRIIQNGNIQKVTVLNLSDLIAGRIHSQIRIESRYDVITQTMTVAEILANFLNTLSKHCVVDYYDCLDNHSRIEPNKAESLDLESLARIIPWYLVERLHDNPNIKICDNTFGPDIITCQILGHNIIGVHGDNDNPATALDKLSLMTQQHYDLLCTAHRHHFQCDEQHQSIIIGNASLMGVDNYSEKLRLTSKPSQTFITVTPDNVCECIYRIILD